jgi:hypothetical protein
MFSRETRLAKTSFKIAARTCFTALIIQHCKKYLSENKLIKEMLIKIVIHSTFSIFLCQPTIMKQKYLLSFFGNPAKTILEETSKPNYFRQSI